LKVAFLFIFLPRPTAVNLMYACDYVAQKSSQNPDFSAPTICRLAYEVLQKEIDMCDKMSENGAALIKEGENILTHCNTGSLATPGVGTIVSRKKLPN
jgi:methylthioribose-1-phosphate isomerase